MELLPGSGSAHKCRSTNLKHYISPEAVKKIALETQTWAVTSIIIKNFKFWHTNKPSK